MIERGSGGEDDVERERERMEREITKKREVERELDGKRERERMKKREVERELDVKRERE